MSVVQEDSVTPSHPEFDPSATLEDEFVMLVAVEDDSDTSSYDDDFFINESYRVPQGNITRFYWQSVHEKLDEIVCETQVPKIFIEINLKEYHRRLDTWGHRSEPIGEQSEVRRVLVETFSDDLHYFLPAETSKSRIAEMVFHLNIHTDCIESVALNVSEIAKKAHEAGKKIVHVVAEFEISEIFVLIEEEEDEEDEEERLARVLRELMDLVFERRVSTVPASIKIFS